MLSAPEKLQICIIVISFGLIILYNLKLLCSNWITDFKTDIPVLHKNLRVTRLVNYYLGCEPV